MSFHAIMFPQARAVPYWCTILLLCSLLSSHAKSSCKCRLSSDLQDPSKRMYTMNSTFDDFEGYLFHGNSSYPTILSDGFGFYKKHPAWKLNLSEPGMLIIDDPRVELWDATATTIYDVPFSVEFTMSIYQPENPNTTVSDCLIFAIIPDDFAYMYDDNDTDSMLPTPMKLINYSCDDTSGSIVDTNLAGNQFVIRVDELNQVMIQYHTTIIRVQIAIKPLEAENSNMRNYSVSIQYNPLHHNMTVQVKVDAEDGQNSTRTGSQYPIYLSNFSSPYGSFSFSSSMGQLFQLHTLKSTVEQLPEPPPPPPLPAELGKTNTKETSTIILSSVLGSAAVTIAMATVLYCYFNSRYRGWKKELDQLVKSMQLLPGVPTQFSFSDIRRATNNFHKTTQLGRGGFGSVYRCRLPSPKKGEALLEVAVKKFSRDDNRRYEDFLAEVSVINRLRHKNIVPLVGWSYNKGEPLLVYEYMPNGSLDQHLFRSSGGNQQQPSPISTWDTRYNMVKDIATGLHYVHHEYEPRVLHRDIKANNIMIDSAFQGRLGDFGLACVVAEGKNSYTDIGVPGTLGFRSPEYIQSGKATTKSDIFAFGVLVLEVVTGKVAVDAQHRHITDWVWHLHKEGRLPDAIDPTLTTEFHASDAKRLLLLGLACSQPNLSDRPTMVKALQIITKLVPPPDVPLEKPRFVWPPEEEQSLSSDYSYNTEQSSLGVHQTIRVEMSEAGHASSSENRGNGLHHRPIAGPSQELFSINHTTEK